MTRRTMADDGYTLGHKIGLAVAVAGFLGYCGYVTYEREVARPAHRPLVILGGSAGPWRAVLDGAPASCPTFGPVQAELPSMGCVLEVEAGEHRLEVRDASGFTVHDANVRIAPGAQSYVWAPEIPAGLCLQVETTTYAEHTQIVVDEIIRSVGGRSGGPSPTALAAGFHDVGVIHAWFSDPPQEVRSRETTAVRRALRLRRC